jgi:hypothetical protein
MALDCNLLLAPSAPAAADKPIRTLTGPIAGRPSATTSTSARPSWPARMSDASSARECPLIDWADQFMAEALFIRGLRPCRDPLRCATRIRPVRPAAIRARKFSALAVSRDRHSRSVGHWPTPPPPPSGRTRNPVMDSPAGAGRGGPRKSMNGPCEIVFALDGRSFGLKVHFGGRDSVRRPEATNEMRSHEG